VGKNPGRETQAKGSLMTRCFRVLSCVGCQAALAVLALAGLRVLWIALLGMRLRGMAGGDGSADGTAFVGGIVVLVMHTVLVMGAPILALVGMIFRAVQHRWMASVSYAVLFLAACAYLYLGIRLPGPDYSKHELFFETFEARLERDLDVDAIRTWIRPVASAHAGDVGERAKSVDIYLYRTWKVQGVPSTLEDLRPTWVRLFVTPSGYLLRLHFGGQLALRWGVDIVEEDADLDALMSVMVGPTYREYHFEWQNGVYFWASTFDDTEGVLGQSMARWFREREESDVGGTH